MNDIKPNTLDSMGFPVVKKEVNSMYTDFINAQKEFEPAIRDSVNPHFRSKYAQLSACIDAVKPALNNNYFAFTQHHHEFEGGVAVETIIYHVSGGLMRSGVLRMPASKQDPQGYASALTYARRNNLLTFMGVAPEDDDGNSANNSIEEANAKNAFNSKRDAIVDRLRQLGCSDDEILSVAKCSSPYEINSKEKLDLLINLGKSKVASKDNEGEDNTEDCLSIY